MLLAVKLKIVLIESKSLESLGQPPLEVLWRLNLVNLVNLVVNLGQPLF